MERISSLNWIKETGKSLPPDPPPVFAELQDCIELG